MLCQLHERLHGFGAERHKRAGDQGLENAEVAGYAEGLPILEEVQVVESEAIVEVKSGLIRSWSRPLKDAAAQPPPSGTQNHEPKTKVHHHHRPAGIGKNHSR
jgi:hypothetical protein